MQHFASLTAILMALAAMPAAAQSSRWPSLDKENHHPRCIDALQLATSAFQSEAFYLFAPPKMPADFGSVMILGANDVDISGGDALRIDSTAFDKLPTDAEHPYQYIYWKKKTEAGKRLAVAAHSVGWRGDLYSLFMVDEKIAPDQFLAKFRNAAGNAAPDPLIADSWLPPWIFQDKRSGSAWVIELGQPYHFLGDWRIHTPSATGMALHCKVHFRPAVTDAADLVPKPVRRLARLLDQTIGPGTNEGTLQPTSSLRNNVQHTLANAALRPWALEGAYNTRAEVDAELLHWSRNGPAYRLLHTRIRKQYPLALRALAEHYKKNFHQSEKDAMETARYVLDIVLRSHYVFPRAERERAEKNENPRKNPWRSKNR